MQGPDGAWAIAMQTAWDTDEDATEFETRRRRRSARPVAAPRCLPGDGGKTRWVVVANDDTTLGKVADALGLAG